MPVLTIAGVLLPVVGAVAGIMLGKSTRGSGGWGLGEIAIFVYLILGGALLGGVCTVLALVRGERWWGLQAIVLLANVGVALFLGAAFLRRPALPAPVGEPAFLALAPAKERLGPQSIILAYPAPDSPEARRGYVIGQRDERGVVTSLRTSDGFEPLKPGELHMQLDPANGRWTLRRKGDPVLELPDKKWLLGTYLEIRVNLRGWGVPYGIADQHFRPVNAPPFAGP